MTTSTATNKTFTATRLWLVSNPTPALRRQLNTWFDCALTSLVGNSVAVAISTSKPADLDLLRELVEDHGSDTTQLTMGPLETAVS